MSECPAPPPGGAFPHDSSRDTAFAPPERATQEEIARSLEKLRGEPLLRTLIDVADIYVMVLNRQRQILLANSQVLKLLHAEKDDLAGVRPGEAFGCAFAWKREAGCGTSAECSTCGAVLAVLESERTRRPVEQDCLMKLAHEGGTAALELRARASQLQVDGETFTVVGLRDISAEKRRDALERVFLHDVGNTVSPLLVWAQLLESRRAEADQAARHIGVLARRLAEDVAGQRLLRQAEEGVLAPLRAAVRPLAVLEAARGLFDGDPVAEGRVVEVEAAGEPFEIVTDESLLVRVLANMMRNALEATPPGGRVRAAVEARPGGCELRVWNAGGIAPEVALQIFKRSFSTKPGRGRGLGTFGMKLFGERYLGGEVGFSSSHAEGTTFFIRLPA